MAIKLTDAVVDFGNGAIRKWIIEGKIYTSLKDASDVVLDAFYKKDATAFVTTDVAVSTFIKNLPHFTYFEYIDHLKTINPGVSLDAIMKTLDGAVVDSNTPSEDDTPGPSSPKEDNVVLHITQSTVGTLVVDTKTALPAFIFSGNLYDNSINITLNATNATMSGFASNENDEVTTYTFNDVSSIDDLEIEFSDVHITPTAAGTVTLDFIIDNTEHELFTYTAEEA